jgi:hypothetical protein
MNVQTRCILVILIILDHSIIFGVIIPEVVFLLRRMGTKVLETCRGFK